MRPGTGKPARSAGVRDTPEEIARHHARACPATSGQAPRRASAGRSRRVNHVPASMGEPAGADRRHPVSTVTMRSHAPAFALNRRLARTATKESRYVRPVPGAHFRVRKHGGLCKGIGSRGPGSVRAGGNRIGEFREDEHESSETFRSGNMRRGAHRSGGVAGDDRPGSGRAELDPIGISRFSRSRKGHSVSRRPSIGRAPPIVLGQVVRAF